MNVPIYVIGQFIIVLLVLGIVSSVYVALSKVFRKMNLSSIAQEKRLHLILSFILAWLLSLLFLNPIIKTWLQVESSLLLFALFLTTSLLLLLSSFTPLFSRTLKIIDGRWLIRIQGLRIATELLFWLGLKASFVPAQMTFNWLNYDIMVGLSALIASQVFFMRGVRKIELLLWNSFGIVSLSYLMFIAIASLPDTSWQLFRSSINSQFLLETPYIWLLGFIYPFFLLMHICSLRQVFFMNQRIKKGFSKFSGRMDEHR